MKKGILLSALLLPSVTSAADIANLSFQVNSGQRHESKVVLPQTVRERDYQIIYQSLSTSTILAEVENSDSEKDIITQWVTYGVSIKAKALNHKEGLYKFHTEYMGKPKLEVDSAENNVEIIDSPDDMTYEVKLALKSQLPVCSEISSDSEADTFSGSKFCISLP